MLGVLRVQVIPGDIPKVEVATIQDRPPFPHVVCQTVVGVAVEPVGFQSAAMYLQRVVYLR